MTDHYDDSIIIPTLGQQLGLELGLDSDTPSPDTKEGTYFSAAHIDLDTYDKIVLCMSGGKDSIASLIALIDAGVDMNRIELWHHDVDGREGSQLMDWLFMADYNRKLAQHFNLPLYFSWLENGFEGEMLKNNSYSHAHKVETPDGLITLERDRKRSKPGTRLKFPQLSASLQTRWCSSALKIDVGRRAINNQERFNNSRTLFITGERREESSNRAKYNQLEPHACDRRKGRMKRHVDAWRPVLDWSEEQVWDALKRHGIIAPVPYRLGWGRSSCMTCIYNSPAIWATINHYFPERTQKIAGFEDQFGTTISRDKINVIDLSKRAQHIEIHDLEALKQATSHEYFLPVSTTSDEWTLPAGAFNKEGCGSV